MPDAPATPTTPSAPIAPIARALISVSDKTGLAELGRFLAGRGVEILSTGGSAKALAEAGVAARMTLEVARVGTSSLKPYTSRDMDPDMK